MFEELEETIPETAQALLYLYIYLAVILVIAFPFPIDILFLGLQLFLVYWNTKREQVLYRHWKKLWRNLKNGSL